MPARNWFVDQEGDATFCGARIEDLASAFGTPLYLMDEEDLRRRIATYLDAAGPDSVVYAAKALLIGRIVRIAQETGLLLDLVTQGELEFSLRLGFPAERIVLHGLHKPPAVLRLAAEKGVGRVVLESPGEIPEAVSAARLSGKPLGVMLRLAPGIDAATHPSLKTGAPASQFGIPIADGQAARAARTALAAEDALFLRGYHVHIGSQIPDVTPFAIAARAVAEFARGVAEATGYWPEELDLGGGLGIASAAAAPHEVVAACRDAVAEVAAAAGRPVPQLLFEPGRYLVGPVGITVYRIVQRKTAHDGRTYLIVDGGMSDNPRPALYGAHPEVAVVPRRSGSDRVDVAGLHCESGDILVRDVEISPAESGDLLVAFDTGAYNHSMASHYNRVPIAPVVFVQDGVARPATRRDNLSDWLRLELGI